MKTGVGGGGVGDRGRWAAGGRLKPPLGLIGLAMSSRSASRISSNTLRGPKRHLSHYHWGELFQTHAFHVVPCMGPILFQSWIYMVRKTCFKKKQTS